MAEQGIEFDTPDRKSVRETGKLLIERQVEALEAIAEYCRQRTAAPRQRKVLAVVNPAPFSRKDIMRISGLSGHDPRVVKDVLLRGGHIRTAARKHLIEYLEKMRDANAEGLGELLRRALEGVARG